MRPNEQPTDVKLQVVARSSSSSSVDTSETIDAKLREDWQPTPPLRTRNLAAFAWGKLRSAFANKAVSGSSTPLRAPESSRVLVVSSSLFLANPFAYVANGPSAGSPPADAQLLTLAQPYTKYLPSTILSVKDTLDWMIAEDDLAAVSGKPIGAPGQH